MSWEMFCVKHAVLGGLPENLPSDIAFIAESSLKVLKADTYDNQELLLLRVCSSTFYHLRVAKRIEINGETGWLVKTVGREIEKW